MGRGERRRRRFLPTGDYDLRLRPHHVGNGNNLTSASSASTPFNRRSELRWDIPLILSNRGPLSRLQPGLSAHAPVRALRDGGQRAGSRRDLPHADRDVFNGQGEAAVTPSYNFWVNPWTGLVGRGGGGCYSLSGISLSMSSPPAARSSATSPSASTSRRMICCASTTRSGVDQPEHPDRSPRFAQRERESNAGPSHLSWDGTGTGSATWSFPSRGTSRFDYQVLSGRIQVW